MGRRRKESTVEVNNGLLLKTIAGVWHCYFRLGGKQFRKSTKTPDLGDAKLLALTWYREATNKRLAGEDIDHVSFARLKRTYLDRIGKAGKAKYHRETIERHFLPFFSRFDDISKIKVSDLHDYLKYRGAKGDAPPTPQTVNRENTVLRQMLRFAVERGWMKSAPVIKNESEKSTRRRRRHFTPQEYRTLFQTGRRRSKELAQIPLKRRQHAQRQLLYDVVMLLGNTGLRVDELKTLIWRNVDLKQGELLLEHAGKTKSSRRLLMRESAIRALQRISERRLEYLSREGKKLNPNEKVIATPEGKPVASFKKGFQQLLKACGFEYNDRNDRHSLTSLRHTYATFRLTSKTGKRASVRALSKQMGTSERMIEQHYGHDLIDDYREELMD